MSALLITQGSIDPALPRHYYFSTLFGELIDGMTRSYISIHAVRKPDPQHRQTLQPDSMSGGHLLQVLGILLPLARALDESRQIADG